MASCSLRLWQECTWRRTASTLTLLPGFSCIYKLYSSCFFIAGLSVFVTLETMVDGNPMLLKRTTAIRKNGHGKSGSLIWQAMSFDISQVTWDTIRNHTILRLSFNKQKHFFKKHRLSNLGQVEIGLNSPVPSAAEHWNNITKSSGEMITRSHNLTIWKW